MIATAPERHNLVESIHGALEHLLPGGILCFEAEKRLTKWNGGVTKGA